jgi:hypothetical protein
MTRVADRGLLTVFLAGAAVSGGLVLSTAAMPSIFFAPSAPEPAVASSRSFAIPGPEGTALSAYAAVFERPLFNPRRAPDPSTDAAQTNGLPMLADYRLVGIVISKASRIALVENRSAGRVVTLRPGDKFAGRDVVDILGGGVTLSGATGTERLVIPKAEGAAHTPADSMTHNSPSRP